MHQQESTCSSATVVLRFFMLAITLTAALMTAPSAHAAETTPPVTSPSPLMGTYGTTQSVTLTCADGSGSGCAATYYCLGSGCTPTTLYSGPVSVASSNTLSCYSTDLDGNSEQVRTYTYTIDPTLAYRFSRLWPQLAQPWYLNTPYSVAVDPGGNVYVADTGNNRIQKFDANGTFVTAWGAYGTANGQFSFPSGITLDPAGNVYVADNGNDRIQKFTANGEFLTAWGSTGSDPGQFSQPVGIAADSAGNIYVIEGNNSRVQKFDSSGTFASAWGSSGSDDGQFNAAYGITVDSAGNIYVADTGNNRIQKFDSSGTYVTSWGSEGSGNGQFIQPSGITIDATGNLYVSDTYNQRIQKFTSSGVFVTTWGSEGSGTGQLSYPRGIAADSGGNVYIADTVNQRLQKFDSSGVPVTAWSSWGSGTGQFNRPGGITVVNTAGYVYVADSDNHRIQEFNSSGSFIRTWGSFGSGNGQFDSPKGVTLDGTGLVYVADTGNDRIQKFNAWGSILAVWGSSGEGNGQFSAPSAIAVDTAGNMYVLDTGNDRVQKLGAGGDFITSWGSSGSANGLFDNPKGIAVDTGGYVYVADTDNSRIQKFDSNGTFITSWGSYGRGNGEFESPHGISVDAAGFVYVTDANNNVIQKFDSSGAFITAWGSVGSGNGEFKSPQGICVDSSNGSVFIADAINNRIQKFIPPLLPGMPTGVTATAGYGQAIISFIPPAANGSSPVLFYRATSSPGNISATGSSPITINGLSGGTSYTFTVVAINNNGTGPASAPSNSVTPDSGYFLTLAVNGSGTVHSSPTPDINCAGSCGQSYASGTVVNLTATPGSGYTFFGWSGACNGSGSCSVTISQAQSVVALFFFTGSNGVCGSAHGGNYSTAPTTNLCTVGTPSSVTGIGPWSWSCAGSGGGTTASCSAAQAGGIIHRSSDSGVNWTPGKTGLGFNNQTNAILVSPSYASDHTLFIGANGGIYKSSDSGDSWTQVINSYSVRAFAASPAYAGDHTLFAGAFTTGVYKSTDSGATWTPTNTGLGSTMIFSLAISPAYASDHTIFAGLYSLGVYKSTDSGATWSAANTGISAVHAKALAISPDYATDRTVFVATSNNHVYRSVDAGVTWNLADTGLAGTITKLAISPAFASDQTLFVSTNNGIYKSSDSGNSWIQVSSAIAGDVIALSPAYASDQTVLASAYGDNIYRSSNGGSSWSPSNSAFAVGRKQLVALALSPAFASDHTVFTATSLLGPYVSVSPGSLSFGNVKTNTTPASRQVTITNGNGMLGDANLAITGMTLSGTGAGQFSISPASCGSLTPVLTVGASCSVDITFTPGSDGSKSATLQIASNNPMIPTTSIDLSGTGISVSSTIATPVTNGTSVSLSGTASCSAGDSVVLVEVSTDGGLNWQSASGTTSWSKSLTLTEGSYTIKSRATTSGGIVETSAIGVSVSVTGTIDTLAPSGTLALYNGVWTLNADARDQGLACLMVYPRICGTLEMYINSSWQSASTTPGTGSLSLRDRAGNISVINGVYWNFEGGPIRVEGGPYPYFSYLQHALNAAGSGNILKLTAAQYSETLLASADASYTIRGGYDSSHGSVTGTTQLNGSLTAQAGTLTIENLDVTGSVTVAGGAVTANTISIQ